jgi:hypothetical protein
MLEEIRSVTYTLYLHCLYGDTCVRYIYIVCTGLDSFAGHHLWSGGASADKRAVCAVVGVGGG